MGASGSGWVSAGGGTGGVLRGLGTGVGGGYAGWVRGLVFSPRWIVWHLVTLAVVIAHGGTVRAEPIPGGGLTVTVHLPT